MTLNMHMHFCPYITEYSLSYFSSPWLGLNLPVCPINTGMFFKALTLSLSSHVTINTL